LIVAWIETAHAITHAASIGSNQSRSNEAYGRTILKTQPSQATAGAQLQSAVLAAVQVSLLNSAQARQISIFT
jgi:hypothetical protein